MQVPAVKPDLLPNTIVHHFTNAADCSSEPMIVETYPADQCYMPNHMGIFQAVMHVRLAEEEDYCSVSLPRKQLQPCAV